MTSRNRVGKSGRVCVCVCVVGARGRLIIFHGGRGPVVGVREARGDAGTTENVADISRGLGMGVTEGRAVGAAEAGGEGRGSVMSRGVDGGGRGGGGGGGTDKIIIVIRTGTPNTRKTNAKCVQVV